MTEINSIYIHALNVIFRSNHRIWLNCEGTLMVDITLHQRLRVLYNKFQLYHQ